MGSCVAKQKSKPNIIKSFKSEKRHKDIDSTITSNEIIEHLGYQFNVKYCGDINRNEFSELLNWPVRHK